MGDLSMESKKSLENIFVITEQREAARQSRTIEQAGGKERIFLSDFISLKTFLFPGYSFNQQNVPTEFSFTHDSPFGK